MVDIKLIFISKKIISIHNFGEFRTKFEVMPASVAFYFIVVFNLKIW